MSFHYSDDLDGEAKGRYVEKLRAVGIDECPYKLPADVWINNPKKWPDVEYPDIYDYLLNTPGVYTKEAMKNRKSLEAYNQFQSGWVGAVLHYKIGGDTFLLRTEVMPSQRLNDAKYSPWVAVKSCGSVICAHCNCMAGLAESCTHIGATLFKLEAAVRMGYTQEACTEKVCQWNNDFVKKVQPARIYDIEFYTKSTKSQKATKRTFAEATEEEKNSFLAKLQTLPPKQQPVSLSLYKGYSDGFHHRAPVPVCCRLPPVLTSFHCPGIQEADIKGKVDALVDLPVSSQQKAYIESQTKLQSASVVWHEMRIGRITASVAHDVLHTSQDDPSHSVMKKLCFPSKFPLNTPAVNWGKDNEQSALSAYVDILNNEHVNLTVQKSGLRLSQDYHFLAASADAVVQCQCHGQWLIEVKCPYKHRNAKDSSELLMDSDFCLNADMSMKDNHRYMTQVQMQLYVYNVNVCHLVTWTPNFFLLVEISRKSTFSNCIDVLVSFFVKHVARELITRQIQNRSGMKQGITSTVNPSNDATLYCYCREKHSKDREMIGCDNDKCPYKWVHFSCAKIKRAPKGSWYCKFCRQSRKKKELNM